MPIYTKSAITSKEGTNFVRSVIENNGSLFIKIEQENDLGIDAIVEFINDSTPLNKQIAVQIKSGSSFYKPETKECIFPITTHRAYWIKYPLPVFGIVYIPSQKTAYWINIKKYLATYTDATVIRFPTTQANIFNNTTFKNLFLPSVTGEIPTLSFKQSLALADSYESSELYLGLLVLFRRFQTKKKTWDILLSTFIERPVEAIPPILIYWLAHIPGHGDIWYVADTPSEEIQNHVHEKFAKFGMSEVIKLLSFIDPEQGVQRGTLGQSVEAIISSLPQKNLILREIIKTKDVTISIREFAAVILAINEGTKSLNDLAILETEGSEYIKELICYLEEFECITPYA